MVLADQPVFAVPLVIKAVTRLYFLAGCAISKGINTGIGSGITTNLDVAVIDFTDRFVFQEMVEIIFFFCWRQAW